MSQYWILQYQRMFFGSIEYFAFPTVPEDYSFSQYIPWSLDIPWNLNFQIPNLSKRNFLQKDPIPLCFYVEFVDFYADFVSFSARPADRCLCEWISLIILICDWLMIDNFMDGDLEMMDRWFRKKRRIIKKIFVLFCCWKIGFGFDLKNCWIFFKFRNFKKFFGWFLKFCDFSLKKFYFSPENICDVFWKVFSFVFLVEKVFEFLIWNLFLRNFVENFWREFAVFASVVCRSHRCTCLRGREGAEKLGLENQGLFLL